MIQCRLIRIKGKNVSGNLCFLTLEFVIRLKLIISCSRSKVWPKRGIFKMRRSLKPRIVTLRKHLHHCTTEGGVVGTHANVVIILFFLSWPICIHMGPLHWACGEISKCLSFVYIFEWKKNTCTSSFWFNMILRYVFVKTFNWLLSKCLGYKALNLEIIIFKCSILLHLLFIIDSKVTNYDPSIYFSQLYIPSSSTISSWNLFSVLSNVSISY